MSPSLLAKRPDQLKLAIFGRVWKSIGKRLRKNAEASPNRAVVDSRLPARHQSHAGESMSLLSQLLLLYAHGDRALRRVARQLARPAPHFTMSSVQSGRLRPCTG